MSFRSTNSKRVIFGPSTCQFGYEHATRSLNLENAVQFQILPKVGYMLCSYLSVVSSTHLQLVLFFSSSNGITQNRGKNRRSTAFLGLKSSVSQPCAPVPKIVAKMPKDTVEMTEWPTFLFHLHVYQSSITELTYSCRNNKNKMRKSHSYRETKKRSPQWSAQR